MTSIVTEVYDFSYDGHDGSRMARVMARFPNAKYGSSRNIHQCENLLLVIGASSWEKACKRKKASRTFGGLRLSAFPVLCKPLC